MEYYLGLTNSPYLHYGYWKPLPKSLDELTLARLRTAQQAYADRLSSFIPCNIKTILDVGCGIGGNAVHLLSRGLAVEGLSPDSMQQEQFLRRTQGNAQFHLTRFEDFKSHKDYDLLLFSESSQYMSSTDIAQGSIRLVHPDGYLLIADMFRKTGGYSKGIFSNCLVLPELEIALKQQGFQLVKAEDISAQVKPTIDLSIHYLRTFGITTLKYIAQLASISVPLLHRIGRLLFRRWLQDPLDEAMQAQTVFEQYLCYQIQLWHLPAED
ncbi:MAG: class I SAM-dependent methyltransferase [Cyanobacteria bacterium J06636_16]